MSNAQQIAQQAARTAEAVAEHASKLAYREDGTARDEEARTLAHDIRHYADQAWDAAQDAETALAKDEERKALRHAGRAIDRMQDAFSKLERIEDCLEASVAA